MDEIYVFFLLFSLSKNVVSFIINLVLEYDIPMQL